MKKVLVYILTFMTNRYAVKINCLFFLKTTNTLYFQWAKNIEY